MYGRCFLRRSRSRRAGDDAGFSLIEVAVALGVVAIGLLALAQTIPRAMTGVVQAQLRTNAVEQAQQRMDDLRSRDFGSAALGAGTYSETTPNYTIQWVITDDQPLPGCKLVEVTVAWRTVRGTRTSELSTFLTGQ